MSAILVNRFLADLDRVKQLSGSLNEQVIRAAFREMLRSWAKSEDLFLLEEHEFETKLDTKVYPDGTIVHDLRVPLGYWEAKDTKDDLDAEIAAKIAKGYPTTNIILENSQLAVLIQNGQEILRCNMMEVDDLAQLLNLFFGYERPEIRNFRRAVEQFKSDLPSVLEALRKKIATAYDDNTEFAEAANLFLGHAKATINPTIGEADIREMLIQHILTEEIFNHIFNEGDFHHENNVAQQLYKLEGKFFRGAVKRDTLKSLEPYYAAIRSAAAAITSHTEKQKFLKVIYENFYKVYNPKAADRLGVVYTPNEIVRFMIDGADWLCREKFGRGLIDKGVNILDPCTGTGTYVCEMLEMFRGDRKKMAHKYNIELHSNEVGILPYYVANLNIEATYAAITGQYAEYQNLCFVDTLDNVAALGLRAGHQHDMFAGVSDENIARVKRQNAKTISVIIGNPPYNANQQSENDNNKNRTYDQIDQSIKDTYVAKSTAQKTKVYDMYARFFRWATDRLEDDGIIAYITNRSFIDSRTFDGFRREVERVFDEIHIVDLGGDVRANPKLSGTKHNVFGIQTGVAITFMVKRECKTKQKPSANIHYVRRPELEIADDKLAFLAGNSLSELKMERITPSKRGNWINQVENEWDDLLPIADKKVKAAKSRGQDRAIFKLFSFGLVTNRDDWLYDRKDAAVREKVDYLLECYERDRVRLTKLQKTQRSKMELSSDIKWTRSVKRSLQQNKILSADTAGFVEVQYRPFDRKRLLFYPPLIEMLNQTKAIFGNDGKNENTTIVFTDPTSQKPWMVTAADRVVDMHLVGAAAGASCLPRYRYSVSGDRVDNITDWALTKFKKRYGKHINKENIFHYCYAVLHDPVYREIYAINLKREIPRVPFYPDFEQWVEWGKLLMRMHISYEEVEPWPLVRIDEVNPKRAEDSAPKATLKSDHSASTIRLDTDTKLTGIPLEAWDYELGNRTAIDWVLDQYKEKKPRDLTIREKFNTYCFTDYKEQAIGLLERVTRVSVETVAITNSMKNLDRSGWD